MEKRWADVLDLDPDGEEEAQLIARLSNVGLDEAGAVGNSVQSLEEFEGYEMYGPSGLWMRSRSFVFFSNHTTASDVPPIVVQGPVDFGVDLVATDADPQGATLGELNKAAIAAASRALELYLDHSAPDRSLQSLEATARLIESKSAERVAAAEHASSAASESLAQKLADVVNGIMAQVLVDPPIASIWFAPAVMRFRAPPAAWIFRGRGHASVELDQLSTAERRWATLAIHYALAHLEASAPRGQQTPIRPVVFIIDEPEAALHRAAEARAAAFLLDWTTDPRRVAFVATHSPELLDLPETALIEIAKRDSGNPTSQVRRLDLADRDALGRLGLRPSDLLRWPKVFLLVEGEHDKQMIDHYFGPRLRAARVELLPMRGAKQLASTIDSKVLFDYTEATIVALLDNVDAESVRDKWQQAQLTRISEGVAAAKQVIIDWFRSDESEESRYLSGWLTSALEVGLDGRVLPFGLSARDVIEYLPASEFVPGATSWEDLHREHQAERALKKGYPNEFKPWLRVRRGVDVTETLIQSALVANPLVPKDLERLMKTLESVSSGPTSH